MKTMVSTAASGLADGAERSDVLRPGAKAGPWVVERELGRGGMGAVYAVVHEAIGKRAALKVVHQRLLATGFNCDRMVLEAKVVNQVGHPNIVDIFETDKLPDGRPYIVMERLEGQSLSERADGGKLLSDLVIGILLQVCDALIAAHAAGVVHRDLKLDNVFLVDNPDDPAMPRVKLLDWGIAKVLSHDVKHTIDGQLVGTPQYLAPEQARGQAVSPQTDVYSLGVMAYELFLEQLPFEAETAAEVMAMHLRLPPPPPSELWPDIPPQLESLLLGMLSKQPVLRPTMTEVVQRLIAVRDELNRRRQTMASARLSTVPPVVAAGEMRASQSGPVSGPSGALERPRSGAELMALSGYHPSATRRWQYATGVLALAAAALLFWISRAGDQAAIAATAPVEAPAIAAPAAPEGRDDNKMMIATQPAIAEDDDGLVIEPAINTEPSPAPVPPPARAEVELVSAPTAGRPSPTQARPARIAPAAPIRKQVPQRRPLKVDPDGTLDPYL